MKPSRNQILCPACVVYTIIYMIINKAKWTVPVPDPLSRLFKLVYAVSI